MNNINVSTDTLDLIINGYEPFYETIEETITSAKQAILSQGNLDAFKSIATGQGFAQKDSSTTTTLELSDKEALNLHFISTALKQQKVLHNDDNNDATFRLIAHFAEQFGDVKNMNDKEDYLDLTHLKI